NFARGPLARTAARFDGRRGAKRLRADVAPRHIDVVERDAAAGLRELERNGAAETGGAAGHDGDPASEALGLLLRLRALLHGGRHRVAPTRRPGIRTGGGAQGVRTYVRT